MSAAVNTGGHAFPRIREIAHDVYRNSQRVVSTDGMNLRDYFAAKAMNAYVAGCLAGNHGWTTAEAVREAYALADAMLAARGEA